MQHPLIFSAISWTHITFGKNRMDPPPEFLNQFEFWNWFFFHVHIEIELSSCLILFIRFTSWEKLSTNLKLKLVESTIKIVPFIVNSNFWQTIATILINNSFGDLWKYFAEHIICKRNKIFIGLPLGGQVGCSTRVIWQFKSDYVRRLEGLVF